MKLSRQEYWSRLPFPPPGDLPRPRDWTRVSWIIGSFVTLWTTRETKTKTMNESTSQRTPYHNQNKNWKLGQGTSLMIQWLRIHLAMQGARVWSLVGELRPHLWAIKPAHCSKGSLCDAARESPRDARKTQLSSKQRSKRTEASKNVNESSGWGAEGCSQDSRSTAVAQKHLQKSGCVVAPSRERPLFSPTLPAAFLAFGRWQQAPWCGQGLWVPCSLIPCYVASGLLLPLSGLQLPHL